MDNKKNIPTVLLILGATGDLMHKKIIPALFNLYVQDKTPKIFHIMGFSRRDWGNGQFRALIRDVLTGQKDIAVQSGKSMESFINLWTYHRGEFGNEADYEKLAAELGYIDKTWKTCSNKLFYIAAPPEHYEGILGNLKSSGLTKPCSPEEGFSRVLIEKPFGKDEKTAARLDFLLGEFFKEEQIYRIDHYLAKEMLQNILSFRFSNALFQGSWSNRFIEKVNIRVWETLGVEKRGGFYDDLGTLRDVGQNHLLQMMALITMPHPGVMDMKSIRDKRAALLKTLITPTAEEIKNHTFRAQYKGYEDIEGVRAHSKTETYFKVRAFLSHPSWYGVPFILESGKRLKDVRKEIVITFRHPDPCFCPPGRAHDINNKVVFQLEPEEGIQVQLLSKKPGLAFDIRQNRLQSSYRQGDKKSQYVEEYEKLLLDAINGDQTLFVRSDEVREMWRFTDPIVSAWKNNAVPLNSYAPDTDEAISASKRIDE